MHTKFSLARSILHKIIFFDSEDFILTLEKVYFTLIGLRLFKFNFAIKSEIMTQQGPFASSS